MTSAVLDDDELSEDQLEYKEKIANEVTDLSNALAELLDNYTAVHGQVDPQSMFLAAAKLFGTTMGGMMFSYRISMKLAVDLVMPAVMEAMTGTVESLHKDEEAQPDVEINAPSTRTPQ